MTRTALVFLLNFEFLDFDFSVFMLVLKLVFYFSLENVKWKKRADIIHNIVTLALLIISFIHLEKLFQIPKLQFSYL